MTTLDLVPVGLAERNTLVVRRFEAMPPGEELELVLDSPPWVLFHQMKTECFGRFEWQDVENGPERWVVRIRKPAAGVA